MSGLRFRLAPPTMERSASWVLRLWIAWCSATIPDEPISCSVSISVHDEYSEEDPRGVWARVTVCEKTYKLFLSSYLLHGDQKSAKCGSTSSAHQCPLPWALASCRRHGVSHLYSREQTLQWIQTYSSLRFGRVEGQLPVHEISIWLQPSRWLPMCPGPPCWKGIWILTTL